MGEKGLNRVLGLSWSLLRMISKVVSFVLADFSFGTRVCLKERILNNVSVVFFEVFFEENGNETSYSSFCFVSFLAN